MTQSRQGRVFRWDRLSEGPRLKQVLADAGYSQTALAATLALSSAHDRQDTEVVCRRVREDSPYDILVRLFWLGRPVPGDTLCKRLPGLDAKGLTAVGLLRHRDGMVRSTAKLTPYYDLLLASDFGPEIRRGLAADHVLGVSAASLTLAGLTVRRRVETALDLGCGAGIQAFLAAGHADRVLGTDTNPRALNFAAFNARLNAVGNTAWRAGSRSSVSSRRKTSFKRSATASSWGSAWFSAVTTGWSISS